MRVVVVSGDKDLLQLVNDDVQVLNPGREGMGAVLYDAKKVEEKWGVPPSRVVDVMALMGDAVDNIPGVKGIGDKGARDLIREFGSVEAALDHADEVKRAAYREGLKNHREDALLSKRLATVRSDVPVTLDLQALKRQEPDRAKAHALFTELEFAVLAREYAPDAPRGEAALLILERMEDVEALAARSARRGAHGRGAPGQLERGHDRPHRSASRWPRSRGSPPTFPSATHASRCRSPWTPGKCSRACARSSKTRRSRSSPPTPSATASCSAAAALPTRASPSMPSWPRTS